MIEPSAEEPYPVEDLHTHESQRIRLAARAAGIGIWEWRLDTRELIYDEQARIICGFPLDGAITPEMALQVTHPDDAKMTQSQSRRAMDPALRDNRPFKYRIRRASDQQLRWIEAHGDAVFQVREDEVRAVSYIGTMQDITQDQTSQDKIIESEARLRLAMDAGELAIWEVDTQTQTITPSAELNHIMGFDADSRPTLQDIRERYAPGEQERLDQIGAEARERGETRIKNELKIIHRDGSEHWLLLNAQVAPTARGGGMRVIGTLMDITDRKLSEQRLTILAQEMRHRVKNTLAVVQSIANQSLRRPDIKSASAELRGRLGALSASTDLMFAQNEQGIDLSALIADISAPFRSVSSDPFDISGPKAILPEKSVSSMGLLIHELCTNAAKYGALSVPEGKVRVDWRVEQNEVHLRWQEKGGPDVISPTDLGFGSKLIDNLARSLGGSSTVEYETAGLTLNLRLKV